MSRLSAVALAQEMERIDWSTIGSQGSRLCRMITRLVEEGGVSLVTELATRMLENETLLSQSETNPTLRRLILYECPATGARLRFHAFWPNADARPHDHSWAFVNYVVTGGYLHTIFEPPTQDEPALMREVLEYQAKPGHSYFMSSHCLHRTTVSEPTTSFIIQGPRAKRSWTRFGETREVYGQASTENTSTRILNRDEVLRLIRDMELAVGQLRTQRVGAR